MGKWIATLGLVWGMMSALVLPVMAQDNGQFCVRAYEDANGNMMRDPGEPLLDAGIIITLYDMRGVVVNTASLEASPTRDEGLVCFRNLPEGQYALFVDSVRYRATTTENMIAQLNATNQLAVLEYGGQRITFNPTPAVPQLSVSSEFAPNWQRVGVAAIFGGGATVIAGILGLLLHLLFIRPHNRRVRQQTAMRYTQQTPPAVSPVTPAPLPPRKNYYEYEDVDEFTT